MPVSLTFWKPSERNPEHGQEIVIVHKKHVFDIWYTEIETGTVDYCWFECDPSTGYFTGLQINYNKEESMENCKLLPMIGNLILNDDSYLWSPAKEYYDSLEDAFYPKEQEVSDEEQ